MILITVELEQWIRNEIEESLKMEETLRILPDSKDRDMGMVSHQMRRITLRQVLERANLKPNR